jgi:hypothetical protein
MAPSGALTRFLRTIFLVFYTRVGGEKTAAVFTTAFGFHAFPPSENMKTTISHKDTKMDQIQIKSIMNFIFNLTLIFLLSEDQKEDAHNTKILIVEKSDGSILMSIGGSI